MQGPGGASPPAAEVAAAAPAGADGDVPRRSAGASGLFGRDLLYVAVLAVQLVIATVVSPILAHVLPADEFGHLASAISLHQVLVVLALVGLDQAMVLMRAESGSDLVARNLIAVGLVVATVLTGLAFLTEPLWGPAMGFPRVDPIVFVVIGWTPMAAAVLMMSALLLSQDRLKAFATLNIMATLGGQLAGLAVVFIGGQRTATGFAVGNLVTLTATVLLGLVLVRPRWRGVAEVTATRRALRLGLPLMISGLAVYVLNASDRLVILKMMGPEDAGRYQIAYVVGNLAVLLLGMIDGAWLPRIAGVRADAARWLAIGLARSGLLKLMAPVILGVTLAAPAVLTVVAPASFRPEELHVVVFLVALAGFPVLLGIGWAWELMVRKRTRGLAVSAVAAAVANVAINIALIPVWGLAGAAGATAAAFGVEALGYWLVCRRHSAVPAPHWRVVLAAAGSAAVSAATLFLPYTATWNLVRFGLAVACLPWLYHQYRAARRALEAGVAGAEPEPAAATTGA